jgi:putative transposase
MSIVDQHHHDVAIAPACNALNVSRATWYRRRAKKLKSISCDATSLTNAARSFHPRRISCVDRQHIFAILCSDRFLDMTPRGAHAALLSQGTYLCSVRTMYRILAQNKAIRERRRIATHPQAEIPRLLATRPNQVWTWDITKLPAAIGGYYNLYVILDLYSRCVVGWRLARSESGALAAMFVRETILAHGVDPDGLSIHADRGAPMTSKHLSQCLSDMNITPSHSRPRTSNDNAYSESQFKTLKYGPAWPDRRMTFNEWQDWCPLAFDWYNNRHHHEGIAYFTPSQVYRGEHLQIQRIRQHALDRFWKEHPERFVRGRPLAPSLPDQVWINRPQSPEQEPNKFTRKFAVS